MSSGKDEKEPGFSEFRSERDARFAALEAAVKTLQDAKDVNARFDKVERKLSELSIKQEVSGESAAARSGRLERIEEGLDALNAREELSARKLKDVLERLSGLEENLASVDKLKAGISGMRENLENSPVSAEEFRFCVRKMGAIEAAFAEFSGKIARQESDHTSVVSAMGDLENRLEYLSVILNRLREIVGKTTPSSSK